MMRIAVVDLWTDDNRGDAALQISLARLLRERHPEAMITGLYRFGFNEFDLVQAEIAPSAREFDRVLGGPRRTWFGGDLPSWHRIAPLRMLGNAASLLRFLCTMAAFRLSPRAARAIMSAAEHAAYAAVAEADLVVWKGKNFREYGGRATLTRALSLTLNILPAVWLGKRIVCVNASFWPITYRPAAWYYRRLMRACAVIVVRERVSLAAARALAPGHPDIRFAPDLSAHILGALRRGRPAPPLASRPRTAAVTVTDWGTPEQRRTYVQAIADAIVHLGTLGFDEVRIVPQVIRLREANGRCVQEIVASATPRLGGMRLVEVPGPLSVEELYESYAGCRLLLGTRMHSCMFARAAGTPFVAIAYDEGAKWSILTSFWPERMVIPLSRLHQADLPALLAEAAAGGTGLIAGSETGFAELIAGVEGNIPAPTADQA